MLECCILFLHHRVDRTTRVHLDLLRRLNPYPVVALTDGAPARLAGSFDVARPEWGTVADTWYSVDTVVYRWFRHGGIRAERYIFLEWDTHATMPVRQAYAAVWDADAAGSRTELVERQPGWHFFCERYRLPPHLRTAAAGLCPFNGILLSHRALAAIAAPPYPDVHCELRIGTLLRHAGFTLTRFAPDHAAINEWEPRHIRYDPARPGIYHPVKDVDRPPL